MNPKDKTATSIRLILNDVQATVEGFADRTTKLTETANATQRELQDTGKLMEELQEKGHSENKIQRMFDAHPLPLELGWLFSSHTGFLSSR